MKVSELIERNPWKELCQKIKENNFELIQNNRSDKDKNVIQAFNQKQSDIYKLRTSMMPAHFTGNILNSKIVLLASNPGYVEKEEDNFYCNPKFIQERVKHLTFLSDTFISDEEERIKESPYWNQKLRWVIDEVGFEKVTQDISLLQFNPYHSIKFREIPKKYFKGKSTEGYLHSQNYGFDLLRNCIDQGKLIVVLRSKKAWFKAVGELSDYERKGMVVTIQNKRQPFLSPKNFETENGFNIVVQAIN